MENTHSFSSTRSVPVKLQKFGVALGVFLFASVVSLSAFIAYSTSKLPPRAGPNWLIHPRIIDSPFTLHRGSAFSEAGGILRIPVYPGATASELSTFSWSEKRRPTQLASLALLRLEVVAPVESVDSWYGENFIKPYSRLREPQILSGPAQEDWFQRLDVIANHDTILYQVADSDGIRGAIIQPGSNSHGSLVTIFRCCESH